MTTARDTAAAARSLAALDLDLINILQRGEYEGVSGEKRMGTSDRVDGQPLEILPGRLWAIILSPAS